MGGAGSEGNGAEDRPVGDGVADHAGSVGYAVRFQSALLARALEVETWTQVSVAEKKPFWRLAAEPEKVKPRGRQCKRERPTSKKL